MPAKPRAPWPLDIPAHFVSLPVPRGPSFRDFHLLEDIVSVDLCAVFNEATSLETIAARPLNGQAKPDDWVPSPDSFRGRPFRR
jgi:hypothetical protein